MAMVDEWLEAWAAHTAQRAKEMRQASTGLSKRPEANFVKNSYFRKE